MGRRRFSCAATYQTRSGGMSWRNWLDDAADMATAVQRAQKRLAAYSKVDIRITDITERKTP